MYIDNADLDFYYVMFQDNYNRILKVEESFASAPSAEEWIQDNAGDFENAERWLVLKVLSVGQRATIKFERV